MSQYMQTLCKGIDYALEHNSFNKLNLIEQADYVCVFGLGRYFEEAFVSKRIKHTYNVDLLCDNNPKKWGKVIEGLPCISPDELQRYDNVIVIIMMGNPLKVQEQLDDMGIPWVTHVDLSLEETMALPRGKSWFESQIPEIKQVLELFDDEESRRVYVNAICNRIAYPVAECSWKDMYTEGEYFGQSFMPLDDNESFVDCGAYNGDTILEFVDAIKKYEAIYGFELDFDNYEKMKIRTSHLDKVDLVNSGVLNENKVIFYGCGSGMNEPREGISILKASDGEALEASVVKLDDALKGKRVSFIKMDIEGSELEGLEGAEKIIKTQGPKLAICVYHKTSDFWKIPILIRKFNSNYKFRLRHHYYINCYGTVLYAYVEGINKWKRRN